MCPTSKLENRSDEPLDSSADVLRESNGASRKNGDWKLLYPFEPNKLQLGDVAMNYVDEGSGDPILMVHGNPTWSFYWRGMVRRLQNGYRTIAVDHVGCGLSDKPEDYDYCLVQHRNNLCRLIDELDLKNITLMAHDWGGAIGLTTLFERRDRFKRVVLFNTAAFPPPYLPFRIGVCRWPIIGKIGVQGLNMFARAAVSQATEQPGGLPDLVARGLLAPYDNWAHRSAIYGFVKDIPMTKSHKTWKILDQLESQLAELKNWPILMMWGMQDWCFRPECLDRLCGHWPEAEVHRIASAGHYVVEDASEQVENTTFEFLDRT